MKRKHKELTSEQYAALTYHKVLVNWMLKMQVLWEELQLMRELSEEYLINIGIDPKRLDPESY